jgi:hypothetical protein
VESGVQLAASPSQEQAHLELLLQRLTVIDPDAGSDS